MYKSNPQLHRLEEAPIGLKSPGLISSISRSQRDLSGQLDEPHYTTSRFAKNGYSETTNDSKKIFMKGKTNQLLTPTLLVITILIVQV